MSISYAKVGNYERYQVRVRRHNKSYSKAFNCANGKQKALEEARKWEKKLLATIGLPKLSSAGRKRKERTKGTSFKANLYYDKRFDTYYVSVYYRNKSGEWRPIIRSVDKHGLEKAIKLAKTEAKRKHHQHPKFVKQQDIDIYI